MHPLHPPWSSQPCREKRPSQVRHIAAHNRTRRSRTNCGSVAVSHGHLWQRGRQELDVRCVHRLKMHLSLIASAVRSRAVLTPARAFHAGSAAQTPLVALHRAMVPARCRSCPGRCTRGQAAPTRAMEVHLNISRAFGAFPNDDTKGEVPTPRAAERPRT